MRVIFAEHFQAALFFALLVAVLLSPVLFFGQAFGQSDLTAGLYPILRFFQSALISDQSLLWSGDVFSGFPLFILGSYFNPFFFLSKFLSVFTLYHWLVFLNLTAAAFFLYWFLRKQRVVFWGGLFGGVAYLISAWAWIVDISLVGALPLLPLLFLILYAYSQRRMARLIILGGGVIGYAVYSVNFNLLPIILLGALLYALYLSRGETDAGFWKKFWGPLLAFLLMVGLGAVLGLPQLLATWKFTALSARASGLTFEQASEGAVEALDFVKLVLPYAKLPLAFSSNYLYVGILPLLFLFFTRFRQRRLEKFFLFLLLISLLFAVKHSPAFWLINKIPFLDTLRVPSRWLLVTFFSVAVLSALGLQAVLEGKKESVLNPRLVRYGQSVLLAVLAVLILLSGLLFFYKPALLGWLQNYFQNQVYLHTTELPLSHYFSVLKKLVDDVSSTFNLLRYKVFLPVVFLVLSFFLLRRFALGKLTPARLASWSVLLLTANFVFVLWPFHELVGQKSFSQGSKVISYLQQHPGRYFTLMPGFSEFYKLTVPHNPTAQDSLEWGLHALPPNFSLYYDLQGLDYYNNLMSRRMARLLAALGSDRATVGEKLSDRKISLDEKLDKFIARKYLLDLLSVRYVISTFPLAEPPWVKVLETSATKFATPVYVYENQKARPLVYLADKSFVIELSEEQSFEAVATTPLGERDILVECQSKCLVTQGQALGDVAAASRKNGFWQLRTDSKDQRWLVVAENNLPGWRAFLDGQVAELYYVNSVFIGIPVPAGQHEIKLQFFHPGFNLWNEK